jgi:methyl-accepting chemotaxis protein
MSRAPRPWIPDLSLRGRIVVLAALPVLGFAATSAIDHIVSRAVTEIRTQVSAERDIRDRTTRLKLEIATLTAQIERARAGELEDAGAVLGQTFERAIAVAVPLKDMVGGARGEALDVLNDRLVRARSDIEAMASTVEAIGARTGSAVARELRMAELQLQAAIDTAVAERASIGIIVEQLRAEMSVMARDFLLTRSQHVMRQLKQRLMAMGPMIASAGLSKKTTDDVQNALSAMYQLVETIDQRTTRLTETSARITLTFTDIVSTLETVVADADSATAAAEKREAAMLDRHWMLDLVASLLLVTVSALLALMIGQTLARGLERVRQGMAALADGRTEIDLNGITRKDELGTMFRALSVLRDNAIERQRLVEARLDDASERAHRSDAIKRELHAFDAEVAGLIAELSESAVALSEVARRIDGEARQIAVQSGSAGGETHIAAREVESAATAAGQIAVSVQEVAAQAVRSDQVAAEAVAEGGRAASAMAELNTQTERVGQILTLINTIAAQTNLLALNATIEAARAGDAGRGFAVVAQEVKALAQQTAAATGDIATEVSGIRGASQQAVALIDGINGTLGEVSRIAASVAVAVEEQSAALSAISTSVALASSGAARATSSIAMVEGAAETTRTTAEEIARVAEIQSERAAAIDMRIQAFLASVRAG